MEDDKSKQSEGDSLEGAAANSAEPAMTEGDSLDPQEQPADAAGTPEAGTEAIQTVEKKPAGKAPKGPRKSLFSRLNIYFLLFLLVIIIALMVFFIAFQQSKKDTTNTDISSQTLTADTINQLKGNDVKIGDPKQVLNIQSNAVFSGRILVQGGTDIAGTLKVGGTTSLNSLTVSGTTTLQEAQIGKLAASGDVSVQGQLTVQKTLNVSGGGSFGGPITAPQITINSLTISGDLQLGRHIDAGGVTPGHSNGTALGAGGTASNSGTDTAGTVAINTGSGPVAGCFVTINFAQHFNATPHVVISPSSSDAGDLSYYVNRSASSFSICANNPVAGKAYSFDYIVID